MSTLTARVWPLCAAYMSAVGLPVAHYRRTYSWRLLRLLYGTLPVVAPGLHIRARGDQHLEHAAVATACRKSQRSPPTSTKAANLCQT